MNEQQQGYLALAGLGAALAGGLALAWKGGQATTMQGPPVSTGSVTVGPSGDIASFGNTSAVPTGIPTGDTWPLGTDDDDADQ